MIKAAAVKFEDKIYWVPPPANHQDVVRKIVKETGKSGAGGVPGFITDKDVFVDRIEAAKIAYDAGQVEELEAPPHLFTSDLWP